MAYIISLTASGIYTALRAYLKNVLDLDDNKIQRAYIDNICQPFPYPFVFVTVLGTKRTSTNVNTYDGVESNSISAGYILDVQLDFYGQDSIDLAHIVKNLFRDEFSVNYFTTTGLIPLYADDIMMTGSEDEKGNWQVRNTLTLHFNINPLLTVSQEYFEELEIKVENTTKK